MDGLPDPSPLLDRPGLTEEDFYRLADEEGDWEFLDGRIVVHASASDRHEDLMGFLLALLRGYLGEAGGAVVRGSRYAMRLDEKWSPEPDILVVREDRRHLMTEKRLEGAADFVVEIVSESEPRLVYQKKLPRYRQAEIPEIWVVDRFKRQVLVEIHDPAGYSSRALGDGRLASTVLPGFWIKVDWLWQRDLPSVLPCLKAILG